MMQFDQRLKIKEKRKISACMFLSFVLFPLPFVSVYSPEAP